MALAVWHFKVRQPDPNAPPDDYYINQQTYLPVEQIATSTGPSATQTTMIFTKFNSHISIALPPANLIQSGP